MEKVKKIPPQEASQTNPVAKPEDTKGGINNKVSSGLIGKKLAEQAEENEEMPMHHLIADKDYPSGIREWMITSPSDLKYPTLVVAAAMLSVYLTRVRIQYVYDNQGEKSAIVLQVIVEGEQSSGKSFARYIMRTLMKPFIERDSEMRAKEQEYAALKRRQGKKDGKLPPEPKTDITILPETVSLTMLSSDAMQPSNFMVLRRRSSNLPMRFLPSCILPSASLPTSRRLSRRLTIWAAYMVRIS